METKQRILAAASTVMTEKGLNESTIAEIAAKAMVAESVIYHYFINNLDSHHLITRKAARDGNLDGIQRLLEKKLQVNFLD